MAENDEEKTGMDLVYFGYEWDENSKSNEVEFIKDITKKFPEFKLKNAFDNIKGYRQEVHYPENKEEDYHVWILGQGWHECSLFMGIKMRQDKEYEDVLRLIELAKKQYPENFKNSKN
jgi:hypothetical protein